MRDEANMSGVNTLAVNAATMQSIAQYWLDNCTSLGGKVKNVEAIGQGSSYPPSFQITIEAKATP